MKRTILRALALCLTTGFVAGYAQAKDDKTSSAASGQSSQSILQGRTSSISEQGGLGASTGITTGQSGQPMRISRLMNTSVNGQSGGSLGQIQDVIIDPTSGQVQFVVLSLSGSSAGAPGTSSSTTTGTGIGGTEISSPRSAPSSVGSYGTPTSGKLVAIPWRLMSRGSGDQLMANVDAARLQSAPSFNSTTWPTMDSAWAQRVNSHFGVDASSTGAPGTSTGTGTGTSTGTGTGIGNPATPGLPSTPGTPDITPPTPTPGTPPSTTPSPTPGAPSATGTGTGTGTSGTGVGTGTGTGTGGVGK
jgi:sporulation protein YlmC with PRC-barrel domain